MRHYPIFLDLKDRTVAVSGAGETAAAKLRLLLKTSARIRVFGENPAAAVREWARFGVVELTERPIRSGDAVGTRLLYCANDCPVEDERAAGLGARVGALVCIVDNLKDSDFITPAIVDRDPVTVAIGTEGAAPVLARHIKTGLEERLPVETGKLARAAEAFRGRAAALPPGGARRRFWTRFFEREGPAAFAKDGVAAVSARLESLLAECMRATPEPGRVVFADAGAGDPGDLTLKTRQLLDTADVVIYDRNAAPAVLELARREAEFVPIGETPQGAIDTLMTKASENLTIAVLLTENPLCSSFARQCAELLGIAQIDFEHLPGTSGQGLSAMRTSQRTANRLYEIERQPEPVMARAGGLARPTPQSAITVPRDSLMDGETGRPRRTSQPGAAG